MSVFLFIAKEFELLPYFDASARYLNFYVVLPNAVWMARFYSYMAYMCVSNILNPPECKVKRVRSRVEI